MRNNQIHELKDASQYHPVPAIADIERLESIEQALKGQGSEGNQNQHAPTPSRTASETEQFNRFESRIYPTGGASASQSDSPPQHKAQHTASTEQANPETPYPEEDKDSSSTRKPSKAPRTAKQRSLFLLYSVLSVLLPVVITGSLCYFAPLLSIHAPILEHDLSALSQVFRCDAIIVLAVAFACISLLSASIGGWGKSALFGSMGYYSLLVMTFGSYEWLCSTIEIQWLQSKGLLLLIFAKVLVLLFSILLGVAAFICTCEALDVLPGDGS